MNKNISKTAAPQQRIGFHWLAIICLIFCQLLVYTWIRTESTQTILRISKAQAAHIEKTSYAQALSVERDRLRSDERITRIAKTRLNLSTEILDQTIYFSGEDS